MPAPGEQKQKGKARPRGDILYRAAAVAAALMMLATAAAIF